MKKTPRIDRIRVSGVLQVRYDEQPDEDCLSPTEEGEVDRIHLAYAQADMDRQAREIGGPKDVLQLGAPAGPMRHRDLLARFEELAARLEERIDGLRAALRNPMSPESAAYLVAHSDLDEFADRVAYPWSEIWQLGKAVVAHLRAKERRAPAKPRRPSTAVRRARPAMLKRGAGR